MKKPTKSKNKKKKNKTTSTADQKTKVEHMAVEPTKPLLEEKQSLENIRVPDEKEPVRPDIQHEDLKDQAKSKSYANLPESTRLQYDNSRAERNDDVSVAEEPSVSGKGNISFAYTLNAFRYNSFLFVHLIL